MRFKYLKSGALSEESLHKAVITWVNTAPFMKPYRKLVIHFPNEGKRSLRYGALMKAIGMRRGVSDLFIAPARHGFSGAWIELKASGGIVSLEQKEFLDDMRTHGYFTKVCWSIQEAIDTIEWYFK